MTERKKITLKANLSTEKLAELEVTLCHFEGGVSHLIFCLPWRSQAFTIWYESSPLPCESQHRDCECLGEVTNRFIA